MIAARNIFASADALAARLAQDVATLLHASITARGHAVLAVSGGTTPQNFFGALSMCDLDWKNIEITLVDERQVDENSPRSNARLVKAALLQNRAREAHFVPLYQNPDAEKIAPFDVVILGMGNDGHTASYFPGGDTLAAAIDPGGNTGVIAISAPGSGEPRLTFTLPRLLSAQHLILHIQGQDKWTTLDRALAGSDVPAMPVRAVLQAQKPLDLYWCP